jgi:FtsP/CotA-like multicopper oxidase with cupredoxin domain
MVGDLMVGDSAGHAEHAVNKDRLLAENDDMDAIMKEPVDAYVKQLTDGANTEGVGNQKLEPNVLPDGTKVFDLTADIVEWQVDAETTVEAWGYNGMVPGPWIRVEPGDKLKIVLHNNLPQSTSIHFHGLELPVAQDGVPDVTQAPVKPGATYEYEFTAQGPALGMYHSHHHAEHQVPDGLLGVFQVGDVPLPADVGPITQEVPMVLNDAGAIGFSLNGKSFPATAPIVAHPGETVEINYFNEGLQIHPMHLHGIPQLVVAKDGYPLPEPYAVDTLNIAPGERYTVIVKPTDAHKGVWAFHCHILNHAERDTGMFGMVTTFIVQ